MKISNLKSQISNLERGQSLFELVVAIAISALIMVAIVSLAVNSIQNSVFSKNKALAATYAQGATEWLRGQRDSNITNFIAKTSVTGNPTSWCLSDTPLSDLSWNKQHTCSSTDTITGTQFLRELKFTTTSPLPGKTIIEADVTVSWTDSKGVHEVKSVTNLADLR